MDPKRPEGAIQLPLIGKDELAARIDHALLKPAATPADLEKAIKELESLNLRCLVVTPTLAPRARVSTKHCIGAVAGFPYGYHPLQAKLKEVEELAGIGVDEVDYVMNTQELLAGEPEAYKSEAKAVSELCRNLGVRCKLIIETPLLDTADNIARATRLILSSIRGDFVTHIKTSTGFAARPTYPEDIVAIRRVIIEEGATIGVKAAGGIRTAIQALLMIGLGADIIGTSKPSALLLGAEQLPQMLASAQGR